MHFPSGQTGWDVLLEVLVPPTSDELRYGAIRESIAAVRSVALHGFSETRAWDGPDDYIVDTGEGSAGVVRFDGDSCFGALVCLDPRRDFSVQKALLGAPPSVALLARGVLGLPFLIQNMAPITGVFWGDKGVLSSNEDWPVLYKYGGEILRRELLADETWTYEIEADLSLESGVASEIVMLARTRFERRGPVQIREELWHELAPRDSAHFDDAAKLLSELGIHVT